MRLATTLSHVGVRRSKEAGNTWVYNLSFHHQGDETAHDAVCLAS